jgi:hypothetical protein
VDDDLTPIEKLEAGKALDMAAWLDNAAHVE